MPVGSVCHCIYSVYHSALLANKRVGNRDVLEIHICEMRPGPDVAGYSPAGVIY